MQQVAASRRRFLQGSLGLAGLGLLSGCAGGGAWSLSRGAVPRLGYLTLPSLPDFVHAAFHQGLGAQGYVVGQTILIETRAAGDAPTLRQHAADLVGLKCDVLVGAGAPVIQPLMEATASIPIISPTLGDPVGTGVVNSLGHPGGNLTGLRLMTTEMSGKRLELLKEAVPNVTRVGVLINPTNPNAGLEWRQTEVVGQALGVHVTPLAVRQPEDFDQALGLALRGQAEALLTTVDVLMYEQRAAIVEFAVKHRLPTMHYARLAAAEGGLLAYDMVHAENYRRAAVYVAKILKGSKPADLPVEQPTKFDFVVNLKTARALGITIQPSIVAQATEVIE